jgi:hypothetical protein
LDSGDVDAAELLENETYSYSLQVGLWTRKARTDLRSGAFWAILVVASVSKSPLTHLFHSIMGSHTKHAEHHHNIVIDFVCRSVPTVAEEFDDLLTHSVYWCDLLRCISDNELSENTWVGTAVLHVLSAAADFNRRIVRKTESFPLKLAWFLNDDPCMTSRVKSTLATEFKLSCEATVLVQIAKDAVAAVDGKPPAPKTRDELQAVHVVKILNWFLDDIESMASNGQVPEELHRFLTTLFDGYPLETQSIEGLNSIIKIMCKIAPALGLPLLSARLNVKKTCSYQLNAAARRNIVDYAAKRHVPTVDWPWP